MIDFYSHSRLSTAAQFGSAFEVNSALSSYSKLMRLASPHSAIEKLNHVSPYCPAHGIDGEMATGLSLATGLATKGSSYIAKTASLSNVSYADRIAGINMSFGPATDPYSNLNSMIGEGTRNLSIGTVNQLEYVNKAMSLSIGPFKNSMDLIAQNFHSETMRINLLANPITGLGGESSMLSTGLPSSKLPYSISHFDVGALFTEPIFESFGKSFELSMGIMPKSNSMIQVSCEATQYPIGGITSMGVLNLMEKHPSMAFAEAGTIGSLAIESIAPFSNVGINIEVNSKPWNVQIGGNGMDVTVGYPERKTRSLKTIRREALGEIDSILLSYLSDEEIEFIQYEGKQEVHFHFHFNVTGNQNMIGKGNKIVYIIEKE